MVTTTPTGIVRIDTETWQVVDRLDAPISDIALSPDGDRLIGYGNSNREAPNDSGYRSMGYFVIDAFDLTVLQTHRTDQPTLSYSTIGFSEAGEIGYVGYYDDQGISKIELVATENGDTIRTLHGWDLQLFAKAGVLIARE